MGKGDPQGGCSGSTHAGIGGLGLGGDLRTGTLEAQGSEGNCLKSRDKVPSLFLAPVCSSTDLTEVSVSPDVQWTQLWRSGCAGGWTVNALIPETLKGSPSRTCPSARLPHANRPSQGGHHPHCHPLFLAETRASVWGGFMFTPV